MKMTDTKVPVHMRGKRFIDLNKYEKNKEIIWSCLILLEDLAGESRNFNFLDPRTIMAQSLLIAKVPLLTEGPIRSTLIKNAIYKWLSYKIAEDKPTKLNNFLEALKLEAENTLGHEKCFSVLFFLPIDLHLSIEKSYYQVNSHEIWRVDWQMLSAFLSDDQWSDAHTACQKSGLFNASTSSAGKVTYTLNRQQFYPYLISVHAYNNDDAFYRAYKIISLFRAAINLPKVFFTYTIVSSEVARVQVPDSPVFWTFNEHGYLAYDSLRTNSNSSIYHYSSNSFDARKTKEYAKWMNFIEDSPAAGTTKQWIHRLLLLYLEAVDSIEPNHAFLLMYQTIENALMLGENFENLPSQKMKQRFKSLLSSDWLHDNLFDELILVRNGIVHRGVFPDIEDKCFDNLKLITEFVINELIKLSSKYPKIRDLPTYIGLKSQPNQTLEDQKKIIDDLLTSRKNKAK
jgi:hypothetical protein